PQTAQLHVGALLERAPGPKYVAALSFAELNLRPPLPRPATLGQMRKQLPEGFAIALRAPRSGVVSSLGALRPNAELEAGLTWLNAAADAVQAQAVVIPTPAELTPGARSRDLLREYLAKLPKREGRVYVWSPSGLWEPEDLSALSAELGVACAFDPLEAKRPAGPVAYGTLRAMGHRTGFTPAALGDALERLLTPETRLAFLSVDAERAFDIAKRAKQIAVGLATELAAAEADADEDDDGEGEAGDDDDAEDFDSDEDDGDEEEEDGSDPDAS
ncbi:MAG TPA: hypothetical protein VJR89_32845, partial [Polyangiales bacterium]|nr:hypothetical protein [Polyangiales bacterium]